MRLRDNSFVSRQSRKDAEKSMKILLIGASGTIGSRIYEAVSDKHEIIRTSRSGDDVEVDITSANSIERMYKSVKDIDAVICAAGPAKFGLFRDLTEDDFYVGLRGKMMGQVNLVRIGQNYINDGGSFTLTTGILAEDPVVGSTAVTLLNAGLNGFVAAAAQELGRGLRVNAVSPTIVEDSVDAYGDTFAGFDPASMERVVNAYIRCITGKFTGRVVRVY
jgi:NAD(P)-dependent dehydrogenase (short-subunit alcohol dehydrogenase family)